MSQQASQIFENYGTSTFKETVVDFDLPLIVTTTPSKPRVHMAGEAVCISCEG